jgi:hypothetical protein
LKLDRKPSASVLSRVGALSGFILVAAIGTLSFAAEFSGQVGLQSDVYMQSFPMGEGLSSSLTSISTQFELKEPSNEAGFRFGVDVGGMVSSQKEVWSLYSSELYLALRFVSDSKQSVHQISFLQKHLGLKENQQSPQWSELDSRWNLGIFEPRYQLDYLRPVSTGLTGLFYEAEVANESSGVWQIAVFGSPFFIPEQGAPISFNAGKCTPLSPWVSCPSSETLLLNQSTTILYDLKVPPLSELLLGKWGGGVHLGYQTSTWKLSGSYLYKPVNQIGIGFEAISFLDTPEVANVIIQPRVLYHHIIAADLAFGIAESADVWVSVVGERPGSDNFSPELTTQKITNAVLTSGGIDLEITRSWMAQFSYLNVQGGVGESVGPLMRESISPFDSRYNFSSAIRVGSRSDLPFVPASKARLQSFWTYDLKNKGSWLGIEAAILPDPQFAIQVGADFLSLLGRPTLPVGAGQTILTKYLSNDRVYGGISYVF